MVAKHWKYSVLQKKMEILFSVNGQMAKTLTIQKERKGKTSLNKIDVLKIFTFGKL
jgi:hypothetical protein